MGGGARSGGAFDPWWDPWRFDSAAGDSDAEEGDKEEDGEEERGRRGGGGGVFVRRDKPFRLFFAVTDLNGRPVKVGRKEELRGSRGSLKNGKQRLKRVAH